MAIVQLSKADSLKANEASRLPVPEWVPSSGQSLERTVPRVCSGVLVRHVTNCYHAIAFPLNGFARPGRRQAGKKASTRLFDMFLPKTNFTGSPIVSTHSKVEKREGVGQAFNEMWPSQILMKR
uniref:Uncharacterized protein n=1 Tax=Steinernema glaseri TaxID=37863 RepID=A0A1I8ATE3_9BILA